MKAATTSIAKATTGAGEVGNRKDMTTSDPWGERGIAAHMHRRGS
jgi:hypothetical protein